MTDPTRLLVAMLSLAQTSDRHVVGGTTVDWYLIAELGHSIIANHGSDAQTIVAEDALAAGRLGRTVSSTRAPTSNRFLVAPE